MKWMHHQAVAHLTGECAHRWPYASEVDRDVRLGKRRRSEEWRHQGDPVIRSAVAYRRAGLPSAPHRPNGGHVVTQLLNRVTRPRHCEATFDVRSHLGPEAQDEPATRSMRQIPRRHGHRGGAPCKRHCHRRAEADAGRVLGHER
jgi:hypothetical protein